MIFSHKHYVPVLKAKRGEKRAIQLLSQAIRKQITPLLEIVEIARDKTLDKHLKTAFDGLEDVVGHSPRYFLDAREIESSGTEGAEAVFGRAEKLDIPFTPVTGISRTADVVTALKYKEHGTAIRLKRKEFETGIVPTKLPMFLENHSLNPEAVDLIVDLGDVGDMIVDGITHMTNVFLKDVPNLQSWKTLILSASSFPQSMKVVNRHSHTIVKRMEWLAWRELVHQNDRIPTYSDCAIQHPSGVEGFDPKTMHVSAAIRYAINDGWLLIKGESTKVNSAKKQFPALAAKLVSGHLAEHFIGDSHCEGCAGAMNASRRRKGYGSAEVWRRLGTVHHITKVVEDLRRLTLP